MSGIMGEILGTIFNTFRIGDGSNSDKTIIANIPGTNKPALRYNHTTCQWEYGNNGTDFVSMASVGDHKIRVDSVDNIAGYLGQKVMHGNYVTVTPVVPFALHISNHTLANYAAFSSYFFPSILPIGSTFSLANAGNDTTDNYFADLKGSAVATNDTFMDVGGTSAVYLGNSATYKQLIIAAEVGLNAAQTFTNKRNTPRVFSTTDISGTPGILTPEIDTYDYFEITTQAHDLFIANHATSTPQAGEKMLIVIDSDSSAHALTYGTDYVSRGSAILFTTTVVSKRTRLGFIWHAGTSKWDLVASDQET